MFINRSNSSTSVVVLDWLLFGVAFFSICTIGGHTFTCTACERGDLYSRPWKNCCVHRITNQSFSKTNQRGLVFKVLCVVFENLNLPPNRQCVMFVWIRVNWFGNCFVVCIVVHRILLCAARETVSSGAPCTAVVIVVCYYLFWGNISVAVWRGVHLSPRAGALLWIRGCAACWGPPVLRECRTPTTKLCPRIRATVGIHHITLPRSLLILGYRCR